MDMQYYFFVYAINALFDEEPDEEVRLKQMLHDTYNDLPIVDLDDARKGLLLQIKSLPQDLRERVETYLKDRLELSETMSLKICSLYE